MEGGCGVERKDTVYQMATNVKEKESTFTIKPVMVNNPWDGGEMTLKEYFEREEKEAEKDTANNKYSLLDNLPKGGTTMWLNHIRLDSVAYQFLWYDSKKGYSGQSLFYRKQRGKNKLKPIAIDCHIPYEYLLVVSDAFEKGGLKAARYVLGV